MVGEYGVGGREVWEGREYSTFDKGVDGGGRIRGCGGEDLQDPAGTVAKG